MDPNFLLEKAKQFHSPDFETSVEAKYSLKNALQPQHLAAICRDIANGEGAINLLCEQVESEVDSSDDMVRLVCGILENFYGSTVGAEVCQQDSPANLRLIAFLVAMLQRNLEVSGPAAQALVPLMKALLAAPPAATQPISDSIGAVRDPLHQLRLFKEKRFVEENRIVVTFLSERTSIVKDLLAHAAEAASADPLEFVNLLMAIDIIASLEGLDKLPTTLVQTISNILSPKDGDDDPMAAIVYPFVLRFVGDCVSKHDANANFAISAGWVVAIGSAFERGPDEETAISLFQALSGIVSSKDGAAAAAEIAAIPLSILHHLQKGRAASRAGAMEAVAAVCPSASSLSSLEQLLPPKEVAELIWPLRSDPTLEIRQAVWDLFNAVLSASFGTQNSFAKALSGMICAHLTSPTTVFEPEPKVREVQLQVMTTLMMNEAVKMFHGKLAAEHSKGLYEVGGSSEMRVEAVAE